MQGLHKLPRLSLAPRFRYQRVPEGPMTRYHRWHLAEILVPLPTVRTRSLPLGRDGTRVPMEGLSMYAGLRVYGNGWTSDWVGTGRVRGKYWLVWDRRRLSRGWVGVGYGMDRM